MKESLSFEDTKNSIMPVFEPASKKLITSFATSFLFSGFSTSILIEPGCFFDLNRSPSPRYFFATGDFQILHHDEVGHSQFVDYAPECLFYRGNAILKKIIFRDSDFCF